MLVLSIVAVPARLFAWDGTGHATGGALTYYILKKNNPARVNKILATLTLPPWYNTKWHDKIARLSPQQKEVSLFMLASTSPDDARRTHYDRPTWHYIDYPFAPPGQGGTPQQPPVPNAETKIDSLVRALKTAPEKQSKPSASAGCSTWVKTYTSRCMRPAFTPAHSRMAITAATI